VSSGDGVEAYLKEWDINVTEKRVRDYEDRVSKRVADTKAFVEKEEKRYACYTYSGAEYVHTYT